MQIELETSTGPQTITINPLGAVTASQLLTRLLRVFGHPIGKWLEQRQKAEKEKLKKAHETGEVVEKAKELDFEFISSLPWDVLNEDEVTRAINALTVKCSIDGKQIDADTLFAGCTDQLLRLAYESAYLNFGSAFKRLVKQYTTKTP